MGNLWLVRPIDCNAKHSIFQRINFLYTQHGMFNATEINRIKYLHRVHRVAIGNSNDQSSCKLYIEQHSVAAELIQRVPACFDNLY